MPFPKLQYHKDSINHRLLQKQLPRGVLSKTCSENMQQIDRRTPIPKCNFTLRHGSSPVNLLHILRTPFSKNPSGWLLLLLDSEFTQQVNWQIRGNIEYQKLLLTISYRAYITNFLKSLDTNSTIYKVILFCIYFVYEMVLD